MDSIADNNHNEEPPTEGDFYRSLCDRAAVALVAADVDLRIVCWNPAAERLLEAPAEEMLGKPLAQAVPENRRSLLEKLLQRTMSRGENSQFDVRLPRPAGKCKELLVVLSVIPGPDGKPRGIAAWVVDETQRKRLAEQLSQAEKIASLGTLSAGIAHHFNNIFGGVATFVDYALTSGDIASMKRALQMTAEAAARASKITQSLLSFAERGTHRADLADLTEVVLTFSHLVERPLSEKKIQLILDLKPVPIIPVEANRMHQVLGNLLTNAEEAMAEGGTISLVLDRREDEVVLTFADNGGGIPAESLSQVFEPFFTTKGLLAGGDNINPGLGLSVVHGIITEMGGHIEVASPEDGGATFTVSFPVPESS